MSYGDALQVLQDVASRGSVTSAEFADLQTIAANLENGISTSGYVASIFYQMVDGSQANDYFTGGNTSKSGGTLSLGNLKAGTTQTQMNELIGKWFLGTDMPDPTIPADGVQITSPIYPTYKAYNYALFGSAGAPQITDVNQGTVGDCELCAGMIEVLVNHPGIINSMFVNDGNGVYGVRFYVNGTPTWVTVNDQLPTYQNSLIFNNAYVATPSNGLWADLIEKAYAQLSSTGLIDHPAVNSYQNISADTAFDVATNLTDTSSTQYLFSSSPYWNSYKSIIINAVNQHDDVVLETGNNVKGTFDASGNQMLVSNHAYAVLGYDANTGDFIVRNPWGVQYGTQNYITQFEVSMSDVASSAVQGDFALDNSAAPNVVFTAPQLMVNLADQTYISFVGRVPSLGAHLTTALAPLFQTQDLAGQAVTQYMFQLVDGASSINLNGATNLATAAQQSAGEIVVSAADLSKLTLTTGAAGTAVELFVSGNDGTGMSTPFELYWTVDGQGLTVLPTSNPAAPSGAVSLASLFQTAGNTSGSVTYTISMEAGLGSFNLNGATNLLSGGGSSRIEVSAADLAKVTYTAPTTAGIAVLDVFASNGSQSSDSTQVAIDVGYSVATALSDFKQGSIPYQIGIADSAANIFGNLDSLQSLMPNWNLLGVLVDDATKQTETISAGQYSADQGVLSLMSGNYGLDVTGATVAQAQSLLGNGSNHVVGVQIADSAADVFAALGTLQAMAAAGQITGITLTDANSVTESVTTAQLSADSAVLNDISSRYTLNVNDSAAAVAGDLSTLQSFAAKGALASVTLTGGGTPTLAISAAQLSSDAQAIADISGNYVLNVAAGTSAANIAGPAGAATIVTFTGNASQYTVTSNGDGSVTVASSGVSDHVNGAEQLAFSDLTMTVAPKHSFDEYAALLYQGALGRTPDAAGLQTWEKISNALPASVQALGLYGLSDASGNYNGTLSVAAGFTNSAEFVAKYGSLTDAQFVTQLYANILDRAPDTGGYNSWINALTPVSQGGLGETREHVLVGFAESAEAVSNATQGFTGQSGTHAAWLFLA